jgi:hypothetical protein
MIKGKEWTPKTLKEVRGVKGVVAEFLEQRFNSQNTYPAHWKHHRAAQAVLWTLLPKTGSNIRGEMKSQQELLEASGYGSRPNAFTELLEILDNETRLITPSYAEENGKQDEEPQTKPLREKYYQLTHDYLVPSVKEWLTRKQKETRRGRAELLLADRADVWNARPENRQLPSLLQWFQIRCLTQKKSWTPPQQKMMRKAGRYHYVWTLALLLFLLLLSWGGYEVYGRLQAESIVWADTAGVPRLLEQLSPYHLWANARLRRYTQADDEKHLHASLALVHVWGDKGQVDYIYGRLLDAKPGEVPVIRDFLVPHKDSLLERLWAVAESPEKGKESQRLRAASALAIYDPEGERWGKVMEAVTNDLVTVPAMYLAVWLDLLRPVRVKLLAPLSAVYRETRRRDVERSLATDILADYAADQPEVLADLLMEADAKQFTLIYPKFKEKREQGLPVLIDEINKKLPSSDEKRERVAKRQANAAVALLRMNQAEKAWPLLKHSPDPRVRSYLIHRLSPLGADARAIIKRFNEESDITIRRALLLSLGEYSEKDLSPDNRKALLPKVQDIYRTASDPGLHASAEWLLRQWKEETSLKQMNDGWKKDREQREKRMEEIKQMLAEEKEKTPSQWYVNGQGQTMVVIPGQVEFMMGSPITEKERDEIEVPHRKRIGQTFALAAKSVTVEQYRRFDKHHQLPAVFTRTADLRDQGRASDKVLRDQGRASDKVEGELLELDGVSVAHRSGDGVCDSCEGVDGPVLW